MGGRDVSKYFNDCLVKEKLNIQWGPQNRFKILGVNKKGNNFGSL